jgi:hypothetical protein
MANGRRRFVGFLIPFILLLFTQSLNEIYQGDEHDENDN